MVVGGDESGGVGGDGGPALSDTLYAELRGIAERVFANERGRGAGHTLQPTAVVNEACLRIMASGLPAVPREQQLAIAARVLSQVLIDHARARGAAKRGGGALRVDFEAKTLAEESTTTVEFETIHAALERLRRLSDRQAEVVTLRLFAGLTMDQISTVLGVSKRTAEGDWTVARAWLRRELAGAMGAGTC